MNRSSSSLARRSFADDESEPPVPATPQAADCSIEQSDQSEHSPFAPMFDDSSTQAQWTHHSHSEYDHTDYALYVNKDGLLVPALTHSGQEWM